MNEKLLPFFRAVSEVNSGVFNRDVLIRHAVALAISDFANLPSSPVENTEVAFNTLVRLNISDLLAEFNEITPLNMANATNLVRAYWKARYNVAFGVARSFSTGDFIGTVSGISVAVSPDELRTLNESALDFDYLYQSARTVVESIISGVKDNQSFPKGDEQAVPSDLITPAIENYRDVCAQLKSIYGSSSKSAFGNYTTESNEEKDKKSLLKKIGEKIAAFFARIKEYIQRFWNWLTGKKKANEEKSKEAKEFVEEHPDVFDPDDNFVKPEFKKRGNGDVSDAAVKSFKDAAFIREEYRTSGEAAFEDLEKKIGVFMDARENVFTMIKKQAARNGFRAAMIFNQTSDPVFNKYTSAWETLFELTRKSLSDIAKATKDNVADILSSFNEAYEVQIEQLRSANLVAAYGTTSQAALDKFSSKKIPQDLSDEFMKDFPDFGDVSDALEKLKQDSEKFDTNRILSLFNSSDLSQEQVSKIIRFVADAQQKIADIISATTRFITQMTNDSIELSEPIIRVKEKLSDVTSLIASLQKEKNLSEKTSKLIKEFQAGY